MEIMEMLDLEALDAMMRNIDGRTILRGHFRAALHNAYPALAAELRALREQIQMIRKYNDALRQERDRLREDYRRLERVRHDLMRRCERMKSLEGLPLDEIAARQLEREDNLRAEAARLREAQKENDQLRSLLSTSKADCAYCGLPAKRMAECAAGFPGCARADDILCGSSEPTRQELVAEAARLREALEYCRAQFDSHAEEEFAVSVCAEALSSTPTTAEWLSARDAEQRRIGAAEWLEKEAAENLERFGTHFYESTTDSMLAEAARLREGE